MPSHTGMEARPWSFCLLRASCCGHRLKGSGDFSCHQVLLAQRSWPAFPFDPTPRQERLSHSKGSPTGKAILTHTPHRELSGTHSPTQAGFAQLHPGEPRIRTASRWQSISGKHSTSGERPLLNSTGADPHLSKDISSSFLPLGAGRREVSL